LGCIAYIIFEIMTLNLNNKDNFQKLLNTHSDIKKL